MQLLTLSKFFKCFIKVVIFAVLLKLSFVFTFIYRPLIYFATCVFILCQMSTNAIAFLALTEELVRITQEDTTAHAHMDILESIVMVFNGRL